MKTITNHTPSTDFIYHRFAFNGSSNTTTGYPVFFFFFFCSIHTNFASSLVLIRITVIAA